MNYSDLISSSVNVNDLITYSHIGGNNGDGLTPEQHNYTQFLHDLDTIIYGTNTIGFNGVTIQEEIKQQSHFYSIFYADSAIMSLMDSLETLYLNPKNLENGKIQLPENHIFTCMSAYTIQHLLGLNGYEIDTDLSVKDYNIKCTNNHNSHILTIPVRYTGNYVNEEVLKQELDQIIEKTGKSAFSYVGNFLFPKPKQETETSEFNK